MENHKNIEVLDIKFKDDYGLGGYTISIELSNTEDRRYTYIWHNYEDEESELYGFLSILKFDETKGINRFYPNAISIYGNLEVLLNEKLIVELSIKYIKDWVKKLIKNGRPESEIDIVFSNVKYLDVSFKHLEKTINSINQRERNLLKKYNLD